jgi:hypothetical protein
MAERMEEQNRVRRAQPHNRGGPGQQLSRALRDFFSLLCLKLHLFVLSATWFVQASNFLKNAGEIHVRQGLRSFVL